MTPIPTPLYRFLHIDNLRTCLVRGVLHAPNFAPVDGLSYKTIHNLDVQKKRRIASIGCGPGGVIHDYVPFYFGYLSPMLLQLKTGQVEGYSEGQEPLIYLVTNAQAIAQANLKYVFSDGHGVAFNTNWFCQLTDLDKIDWAMVYQRYWAANYDNDLDRQRRKQAEFLVHKSCAWSLIQEIGVINSDIKQRVEEIFAAFEPMRKPVIVRPEWYY